MNNPTTNGSIDEQTYADGVAVWQRPPLAALLAALAWITRELLELRADLDRGALPRDTVRREIQRILDYILGVQAGREIRGAAHARRGER